MKFQKNAFSLTILAVCFCCVAVAEEDKPAPVEEKLVAVEDKPFAVEEKPAAGGESNVDGKTNIAEKRNMPDAKGTNGQPGSKSLTRSGPEENEKNIYCDPKLCPAGRQHVGCDDHSNVSYATFFQRYDMIYIYIHIYTKIFWYLFLSGTEANVPSMHNFLL